MIAPQIEAMEKEMDDVVFLKVLQQAIHLCPLMSR
jgi:hypothetical protein